MKRPRKYRLSQPPRQTELPGPGEITILHPRTSVPAGPPVTPLPGSPAPEVMVLQPRGPKPDRNRLLKPSCDEIGRLPRWAKVAFAARCARRVLPLFRWHCPDAAPALIAAVSRAVEVAEQCAGLARGSEGAHAALSGVDGTYKALANADAAVVARDAVDAVKLAAAGATSELTDATFTGSLGAFYLLVRVATLGSLRIVAAPTRDLDRISRLAKEQNWTDETPVPQDVFGPMWDREPPPWWREDVPTDSRSEGAGESKAR